MKSWITSILIISLFLYGATAVAQTAPVLLEGRIGDTPARMILQQFGNELKGNYYYLNTDELRALQGEIRADGSFELSEHFMRGEEVRETVASWKGYWENGQLSGTWAWNTARESRPSPVAFSAVARQFLSPVQLESLFREQTVTAEVKLQLMLHITGVDWQWLAHGSIEPLTDVSIQAEEIQTAVYYCNFFGDKKQEAVLHLKIGSWIYLTKFYYQMNNTWLAVPGILAFERSNYDERPCLGNPPGEDYFYFWFKEVTQPGQYLLEGRTFGGSCGYATRGNYIQYFLWQIQEDGIHEVYRDVEHAYWYEGPDPTPLNTPIQHSFRFVENPQTVYPRVLQRSVYSFSTERTTQPNTTGEIARPFRSDTELIPLPLLKNN